MRNEMVDKKENSPLMNKLLDELKEGPKVRSELVDNINTPRTTIYDALRQLIITKQIKKGPIYETDRSRGRPRVAFTVIEPQKED